MTTETKALTEALTWYESQAQTLFAQAIKGNQAALELALAAEAGIDRTRGQLFAGRTWAADGGAADRTGWCQCGTGDDIQYAAYTAAGTQEAHGFICSKCRKITQTG